MRNNILFWKVSVVVNLCQYYSMLSVYAYSWKHQTKAKRKDIQNGGSILSWALIQTRLATNTIFNDYRELLRYCLYLVYLVLVLYLHTVLQTEPAQFQTRWGKEDSQYVICSFIRTCTSAGPFRGHQAATDSTCLPRPLMFAVLFYVW